MSTSAGRPPELLAETVSTLVCKFFKFDSVQTASVKSFPSFEDRNYYFVGQTSNGEIGEYILEVSNPIGIQIDQLRGINQLMNHLKSLGLCLGYPLTDHKGEDVVEASRTELLQLNKSTSSEGAEQVVQGHHGAKAKELVYYLRVLVFVPGTLLHCLDRHQFVPSLLYSMGEKLAIMDKALMNFSNESLERRHLGEWDLTNFVAIVKRKMAGSPREAAILKIIQGFEDIVKPILPTLNKSIIHFDVSEWNIIVSNISSVEYQFKAFIDFGDAIETYTVIDLAVFLASPMAYQVGSCVSIVKFVSPIIRGYNDILPLSEGELNCLYYLILARSCLLALNCEICYKAEPWNDYIGIEIDKNWNLVHLLLDVSKEEVVRTWKQSLC